MSLPHLPQELLDTIFESLNRGHRRSLAACSLVHRSWTYPAHRVLFQSLTFNMSRKSLYHISQFISSERGSGAIPVPSHVRHLIVNTGSLESGHRISVSTIADIADWMPRLKTLSIIQAVLSPPADVRCAPPRTLDCLTLREVDSQVSAENVIKTFAARYNVRRLCVQAFSFKNVSYLPAPPLDDYSTRVHHVVVHSNEPTHWFLEGFAQGSVRSLEVRIHAREDCAYQLRSLVTAGTIVERITLDMSMTDCLLRTLFGPFDVSGTFRHLRDVNGLTAATLRVRYLVKPWNRNIFNTIALRLVALFLISTPSTAQCLTIVLSVVPGDVPDPHALVDALAAALTTHIPGLDALHRDRPALKALRWTWHVLGTQTAPQAEGFAEFERLFRAAIASLCPTSCAKGIMKFGGRELVESV